VDPSAHPQHMNDLKHHLYVWSGYRNHSTWVWGLNQCTMTSFDFLESDQHVVGSGGTLVDPSAHPQHMNDLKHILYVWSGCGMETIPCGS
jgi:hypothetical protein